MRTINTHRCGVGLNERITIQARDARAPGDPSRDYRITIDVRDGNVATLSYAMLFQTGDPQTEGLNGVTCEVLLAIVLDRLQAWGRSRRSSTLTGLAVTGIRTALVALHSLTHEGQLDNLSHSRKESL